MSTNINDNLQVQAGECLWTPPPGVIDHLGNALAPDRDFFVRPPREIGDIKSAHTSLKKGVKAKPAQVRLAIAALWGLGGFLLAMGINRFAYILDIPSGMTGTPIALWAAIIGLLPAYIAWRKLGFKHFCQFVGVDGCAQISCKGERENIIGNSVFCFKDAAAISTSVTRHYRNGIYTYTSFYFNWYPAESEKAVFTLSGTHSANLKTPPAGNSYHYLRAAESAWYDYLIPKADAELTQNGYLKFHMGHNRYARVGRGFIEIVEKDGAVNRCEAGDIGSAKLASGNFTLTRKDATSTFFGLLGSSGTFHFNYSNMYNGRLFLLAFQKFLNIKVG
ncbi:MAG TPA: hypothetical protein VKV95_21110 [Terriglobia bacterium]|nr:hypothetical protein [Terriglobia bacterium]